MLLKAANPRFPIVSEMEHVSHMHLQDGTHSLKQLGHIVMPPR